MVSDKMIHKAFRTNKVYFFYKQNPLEKCFVFTIYQKLYIGFNLFKTV